MKWNVLTEFVVYNLKEVYMKKLLLSIIGIALLAITVIAYAGDHAGYTIDTKPVPVSDKIAYMQVYGVFVRNCAGCHNAETPGMNWLSQEDVEAKKATMYGRVFVKGDMPLFFRFFGGADRELLKKYLQEVDISN
jgi:mono/diheme cytochrome c family protein